MHLIKNVKDKVGFKFRKCLKSVNFSFAFDTSHWNNKFSNLKPWIYNKKWLARTFKHCESDISVECHSTPPQKKKNLF